MFQANMTLEERMSRATVAWMRKEPALAGVLMIGETYLEMHEVYHKMYRHPTTWGHLSKINPVLANMSMDYVIDWLIMEAYGKDGFVEMPENIAYGDGQFFSKCCYDPQFAGWDTAKVFWHLYKELD